MSGLFSIASKIFKDEGLGAFCQKGFQYGMQQLSVPACKKTIQGFNPPDVADALDFAYSRYFGLLKPAQVRQEIEDVLALLSDRKAKTYFEIGTLNGGTLFLFSRILAEDARLVSVDLPWGEFGYGYPPYKIPLYEQIVRPTQELHLIRDDSHQASTLEKVKAVLNGGQVDILFLDGDHTYDGVKQDYEMYHSLVADGGVIVFHDVALHPEETGCDVYRFWNEIKEKYPDKTRDIIADPHQGWAGIGVLFK